MMIIFWKITYDKEEASGIVVRLEGGVASLYRYNSRGFRLYNTCFYKGSTMGKSFHQISDTDKNSQIILSSGTLIRCRPKLLSCMY